MNKELEEYLAKKNLEYLREYLNLIHSKEAEHDAEFKKAEMKRFEIYVQNGGDPELYEDEESEELALEQFEIRELMYRSFIVSAFMFMEQMTNNICRALQSKTKQLFTYKDMGGIGIGRSINYLTKILGEHPINDTDTREAFDIARLARNAIVHSNGQLSDDEVNRIEKLIKTKRTNLKIGWHDLDIRADYAESTLELAKMYADLLLARLD